MKSRGRHPVLGRKHTHTLGAGGLVGLSIYILSTCISYIYITHTYMITHTIHYPHMHSIYILYTDILLYTQGGKHAASACKGGIYPHKKGSTRKREQMIRGDRLSIKPVAGTVHLERKKGQMVGIKASVEKGPRDCLLLLLRVMEHPQPKRLCGLEEEELERQCERLQ